MSQRLLENIKSAGPWLTPSPSLVWPLTYLNPLPDAANSLKAGAPYFTPANFLNDASGNGNNAANGGSVGNPSRTNPPITADPYEGNLRLAAAPAEYLTSSYNPFGTGAGTAYTVMWVQNEQATAAVDLFSGSGANGPWAHWVTGGSTSLVFRPDKSTATGEVTWTGVRPSVGVTAVFHLVHDWTNNATLYKDGLLVSQQVTTKAMGATVGNFQFGGPTVYFDGYLGWIACWPRQLLPTDVSKTYAAVEANQYGGSAKVSRLRNYSPAPSIIIPMNAQYGYKDQSGNGRDAQEGNVAAHNFGPSPGSFFSKEDADTSTRFDFNAPAKMLKTTYQPFVAGQPISAAGLAYSISGNTTVELLFGSDGTNKVKVGKTNASQFHTFSPDGTNTYTSSVSFGPNDQFTAWGFSFNPTTDAVRFETLALTTAPSNTITVTTGSNTGDFGNNGNLWIGAQQAASGLPWNGYMAHFCLWANTHITDFSNILGILIRNLPGRVIESP